MSSSEMFMSIFERFKQLSPALKIFASLASFLSSVAGIAALYFLFNPITPFNPELVGRWNSDYAYPITDGTVHFKGLTNVFHEGRYNVSGVITVEGSVKQQPYTFIYNIVGAGSWTADSERMSITLQTINSTPKSLELSGVAIDPLLVEKITGKPLPGLSDAMPSGMSDEYKLESVAADAVVLQATDPFGKPYQIEMHRES